MLLLRMIDKDEALWVESKLGLDPNGELKSIFLINMTHPSFEKALDEINPRATNPWEILDNKTSNECHRHGMMEAMFSPIDIHEETPLELEKEDDINEHGSYFMNISSNPCSLRNLLNQLVSPILPPTKSSTPSYSLFIKTLKGWL